jgi:hypothetical protein
MTYDFDDSGYMAFQLELEHQEFLESEDGIDFINLLLIEVSDTKKELHLYYE